MAENALVVIVGYLLTFGFIPWILARKRDPAAAIAWCLAVILLPYAGAVLFLTFGETNISRPLSRWRRRRRRYMAASGRPAGLNAGGGWNDIARTATRLGAAPCRPGNAVGFFHEGRSAYAAMETDIRAAAHHVYAQFFAWHPDATGRRFIDALAAKAADGVRVRVLYDSMGSHDLTDEHLRPILAAGGRCARFLAFSPLRRRVHISLRNHRKVLAVDGHTSFTGGLNIGDEYTHRGHVFPYWRDTQVRIHGPAAADLERAVIEDWHFTTGELLPDPEKRCAFIPAGPHKVQILASGPDQSLNTMHAVYFRAMTHATRRLWIMSPYFVPGPALLSALANAALSGVDVRVMAPGQPDHYLTWLAANYYWDGILNTGVRIFRYTKGMMHSKVLLVDGQWATVGTANLDMRSMRLNFEVNAAFDEPDLAGELEAQFERDLADCEEVVAAQFRRRPLYMKGLENFARLFSPLL